jgi:uncharacterized OB-fold protein
MSQAKRELYLRKQKERGDVIPKHCWQCGTVHYPAAKACEACGGKLHETERQKRQGGAK